MENERERKVEETAFGALLQDLVGTRREEQQTDHLCEIVEVDGGVSEATFEHIKNKATTELASTAALECSRIRIGRGPALLSVIGDILAQCDHGTLRDGATALRTRWH